MQKTIKKLTQTLKTLNVELDKFIETRRRALAIIYTIRASL